MFTRDKLVSDALFVPHFVDLIPRRQLIGFDAEGLAGGYASKGLDRMEMSAGIYVAFHTFL